MVVLPGEPGAVLPDDADADALSPAQGDGMQHAHDHRHVLRHMDAFHLEPAVGEGEKKNILHGDSITNMSSSHCPYVRRTDRKLMSPSPTPTCIRRRSGKTSTGVAARARSSNSC